MGLIRNRDGDGIGGTRFQLREKVFSIGDDFWIENEQGERAFKVNGKALRIRSTFVIEGPHGEELFKVQEKKLSVRDRMDIEAGDRHVASIRKKLVSPLRDRFTIELEGGGEIDVKGNVLAHEYEFERDGTKIAEVSKRWFRMRDIYGIEIAQSENAGLILAAAICIDEMVRD